jgi:hypothetical protein
MEISKSIESYLLLLLKTVLKLFYFVIFPKVCLRNSFKESEKKFYDCIRRVNITIIISFFEILFNLILIFQTKISFFENLYNIIWVYLICSICLKFGIMTAQI